MDDVKVTIEFPEGDVVKVTLKTLFDVIELAKKDYGIFLTTVKGNPNK